MARVELDVAVPFDFCSECDKFKLEVNELTLEGEPFVTAYTCEHAWLCGYVVGTFRDRFQACDWKKPKESEDE